MRGFNTLGVGVALVAIAVTFGFQNCAPHHSEDSSNTSSGTDIVLPVDFNSLAGPVASVREVLRIDQGMGMMFCPPPGSPSDPCHVFIKSISVLEDGRVIVRRGLNEETKSLAAVLNPKAIKNLKDLIATIDTSGGLIDQAPGQPLCADAPSTTFSLFQGSTKTAFYSNANCHEYAVVFAGVDRLTNFLRGVIQVAEFSQ